MMVVFFQMFEEVSLKLLDLGKEEKMRYVHKDTMKKIIDFYKPWESCYKLASTSDRPSIHHAIPVYEKFLSS